jgi:hypothetical protein
LLVRDARQIEQTELVVHIARVFGWQRTGSEISDKVGGCIGDLVDDGTLGQDRSGLLRSAP